MTEYAICECAADKIILPDFSLLSLSANRDFSFYKKYYFSSYYYYSTSRQNLVRTSPPTVLLIQICHLAHIFRYEVAHINWKF